MGRASIRAWAGANAPVRAALLGQAEDQLAAEIEAEAAVAMPAHEGVDRAATLETDQHALAETGSDVAFDLGAAGRDVDHRHAVLGAAEGKHGAFDQAMIARLGSRIDVPCLSRHDL